MLFAGALLFSRGWIGGGDAKLVAAAALWAGPDRTLPLLVLTGLLGGLLTVFLISPAGALLTGVLRTASSSPDPAVAPQANPVAIPYGVAIAAAAVIVTIPSSFSF